MIEKKVKINEALVKKIVNLVSKGLPAGMGNPKPGQMCVEAVVAFATGEEHNDRPRCVKNWLALFKIDINDNDNWASNKMRGLGLRRLAIAQLGSAYMNEWTEIKFWEQVNVLVFQDVKRTVQAEIASVKSKEDLDRLFCDYSDLVSTAMCNVDTFYMYENIYKCSRQEAQARACETYVQALLAMKVPGTKFLHLAPVPDFRKFSTKEFPKKSTSK